MAGSLRRHPRRARTSAATRRAFGPDQRSLLVPPVDEQWTSHVGEQRIDQVVAAVIGQRLPRAQERALGIGLVLRARETKEVAREASAHQLLVRQAGDEAEAVGIIAIERRAGGDGGAGVYGLAALLVAIEVRRARLPFAVEVFEGEAEPVDGRVTAGAGGVDGVLGD